MMSVLYAEDIILSKINVFYYMSHVALHCLLTDSDLLTQVNRHMTPEEKRAVMEKMDRKLLDAYGSKGKITTSRDSFPITNKARTDAYHAERNRYARDLGMGELWAEDYKMMAAEERRAAEAERELTEKKLRMAAEEQNTRRMVEGRLGYIGDGPVPKGYTPLTVHAMDVPLKWQGRRQGQRY